ncbi:ABC transporter ATP-binding protein [Spiroplasma endosymbiont of Amphimallon solstitiale]|uniref:ABC transporter ATP-binding protein n=1 Tax=Spiroplasma endosymbiont of Amphimallon solstitiale TaxID=3066288 RepID=UPI00313F048B
MNIIQLKNLTKEYSPNIGCFDINLSINKGEVYGFIGPNGAGKTTVIRQMIGFIKSDTGFAKILDYDCWKESAKIMEFLGYLAGEVTLPDYMSGIVYLKTVANIRKNISWAYVEKLINYFELDAKRKIKKMSKGMKQKVAIISAFMHKPKVLVLDEPTSGLDPLMQERFNTLIRNSKNEGATIFMSSHIFGEIENICDKVAVIKKGKIISEISIKEIQNSAKKNYEIKFSTVKDYNDFLNKKWDIIEKNNITKVIKVNVLSTNVDKFLKELSLYKVDNFKELPFSLEEYFIKFYKDEVNFND